MKRANRIAVFAIIVALLGQGISPGVILCHGEEGHKAVEAIFDPCCSSFEQPATHSPQSVSVYDHGSDTQSACGPCSDTILTADPFTVRTHDITPAMVQGQIAHVRHDGVSSRASRLFAGYVHPAEISFIPIEFTCLLI